VKFLRLQQRCSSWSFGHFVIDNPFGLRLLPFVDLSDGVSISDEDVFVGKPWLRN